MSFIHPAERGVGAVAGGGAAVRAAAGRPDVHAEQAGGGGDTGPETERAEGSVFFFWLGRTGAMICLVQNSARNGRVPHPFNHVLVASCTFWHLIGDGANATSFAPSPMKIGIINISVAYPRR